MQGIIINVHQSCLLIQIFLFGAYCYVDSVTEFHEVTSNRADNSIDKKIRVVHILGGIQYDRTNEEFI